MLWNHTSHTNFVFVAEMLVLTVLIVSKLQYYHRACGQQITKVKEGSSIIIRNKFFPPLQSEVTALDVAKVFNHEDVIQELTSQMSSVRQHEQQRTTTVSYNYW